MNEHSPPTARLIRFGAFELDPKAGELRKSGMKTRLPEQSLQLLMLLLQQPGEVVTREEMRERLWPDGTFVDFDHSLNAAMKRLREALDDSADSARFVETLPRHGYRFIYPVDVGAHDGAPPVAPVSAPAVSEAAVSPPGADVGAGLALPSGTQQAAPLPRRWIVFAAGVAMLAIVAALLALDIAGLRERLMTAVGARPAVPLQRIQSIAVLPLENLSGDKEQEYFADGMTEELITTLGKIGSLRVISRTSVMRYKRTKIPIPEIARELHADAVVEGTVMRSGDRVRITANLLDARSDHHLWAEAYERDVRDVLALQGEVARSIAREVQVKLTPQEATRLAKGRAVNPQAYEAYLRAKYTNDLSLFEEAIHLDPQFALPHAGLAGFYQFVWGFLGMRPPPEAYPKAEQAALHALSLDDTLSDAHAVLGLVRLEYNWNFPEAERELRRALELNPNSDYRHFYAHYLLHMGRLAESRAESERAVQISPFDMRLRACLGWHCLFARDYDEAEEHCREALRTDPNNFWGHLYLGWTLEQKQMLKEAIAEFKAANTAWNEPVMPTASLAHAYAISGRTREARSILTRLINRSKRGYVSAYDIAVIYAGLGEPDRAFEWLDKAYNERSSYLIYFRADPRLEALRSDERFQALMRRIGLPP